MLPMVVSNAPAWFSKIIIKIFLKLQYEDCVHFLDDVIAPFEDFKFKMRALRLILGAIRESGLKLKPSKCLFLQTRAEILGAIIDANGIHADPKKLAAVAQWLMPTTKKKLQRFLGMVNYLRNFFPKVAKISLPFTDLPRADVPLNMDPDSEGAFNQLKAALTCLACLAHYNPSSHTIL